MSAQATLLPSAWAENEVELARQWGLLSARSDSSPGKPTDGSYGSSYGWNNTSSNSSGSGYGYGYASGLSNPESYTGDITKDAFCQIVMTMSEKLLGETIPAADVRFSDETTPGYYYRAYGAGIISGTGFTADGAVIPGRDAQFSREQIAKMLYQAIVYCRPDEASVNNPAASLESFSDGNAVSSWARTAAAYMAQNGIIQGVNGQFLPQAPCSFEQGVILAKRVFERFAGNEFLNSAPMLMSGLPAPVLLSPQSADDIISIQNGVAVQWQAIGGVAQYLVKIDFPGQTQTQYIYTSETKIDVKPSWNETLNPGPLSVSIAAADSNNVVISPFARLDVTLGNDTDYFFDFTSAAEAAAYMKKITIAVWDINSSGEKVTKTMSLTVHRWVADDVIAIFNEIYNGPEQFPIHCIGGYRTGTGEHGKGTAIDINWDENYEIFADGHIGVGKLWLPGENPYSIPLEGDVVKAFRAHGWGWGGTDWRKKNDYMHFSYFGT